MPPIGMPIGILLLTKVLTAASIEKLGLSNKTQVFVTFCKISFGKVVGFGTNISI